MVVWAVLLGHAALWMLVLQSRRPPAGAVEARRSLVLQLLPSPRPPRVEARQPVAAPAGFSPRRALAPPVAAATDIVAVGTEASPSAAAAGAAPSPGAPASSSGALNLKPGPDILRGALANPATTDPRSNSPKPTFEERIAMGLDPSLCVKLERDAEGVVRRRMGRLVNATSLLQASHGVGAQGLLVCE